MTKQHFGADYLPRSDDPLGISVKRAGGQIVLTGGMPVWGLRRISGTGGMGLDIQRAKEIIESPSIINVTYRGKSVHLDEVYEMSGLVKVHFEDGTTVNADARDLQEN